MQKNYYQQLLIFHTIAKTRNISAAARQLEVSVAAVSKSLQTLEQHLGLPLIQRTTRKLTLTEAGEKLVQQTTLAVKQIEHSLTDIQSWANPPAGLVRITLPQLAFYLVLQPNYAEFCQQYPQIQLELSIDNATVDIVEQHFDLGIRFGHSIEDGMIAHQLTTPMQEGLFVSKQYALQYGIPQTPTELSHHQLIGHRFITHNRLNPLTLNLDGFEKQFEVKQQLILNDTEMVVDAVLQGFGIGRIFDLRYQQLGLKDQLIPVLQPYWRQFPALYLYYFPRQQQLKRAKAVIDFLLAHRTIK
ncbi:LysR family transcriptional regulator [Gallibacterium genomosp. 3]|uniref:LysR family transcriptional regulator n=1 Tax=Gallibacterium genomosp. 3 TaxID=505345 RepID=A0A1A7NMM5_9PAST|nr:LysR family transcriptional regulator [Gallibacterium genomosp. 3]OBW91387.1 LysR family transcriptional regulator [Gallibacterium genomosp. 3]